MQNIINKQLIAFCYY